MSDFTYKEKQRLRSILPLTLVGAGTLLAVYQSATSFLDPGIANWKTVVFAGLALGLGLLLRFLLRIRLKLSINQERIKFKMSPFHDKARKIGWDEVEDCELVKTHPLAPNHGSRIALGGERRFTLCGRNGLAIRLKDGRRYFIGCRDVDELGQILPQLG